MEANKATDIRDKLNRLVGYEDGEGVNHFAITSLSEKDKQTIIFQVSGNIIAAERYIKLRTGLRSKAGDNNTVTVYLNDPPRRVEDVKVRLTPDEHEDIKERAEAAGLSAGQYIRDIALGFAPKPVRLRTLRIRVTPDEQEEINTRAASEGISANEYLRRKILKESDE